MRKKTGRPHLQRYARPRRGGSRECQVSASRLEMVSNRESSEVSSRRGRARADHTPAGSDHRDPTKVGFSATASRHFAARLVYVVAADESVRNGLRRVIESAGFEPAACASLDAFLGESPGRDGACAVLDISSLRACAPALWARLRTMAARVPVVALFSRDDPEMGRT